MEATWADLRQKGWSLMWEKWPWWVIAVVISGITYYAQSSSGAVISGEKVSLGKRLLTVPSAYWFYVTKAFWPKGQAVVYPGLSCSWAEFVLALVILGALTLAVVRARRSCAPLLVGWLWFGVTLLPVIGLVRVGAALVADRFTYIPLIGLFLLVVWGMAEFMAGWRFGKGAATLLSVGTLIGCLGCTWFQLKHWQNSITLFEHALAVTANNDLAHGNLGIALFQQGKMAEAIGQYEAALRLKPGDAKMHNNLAVALYRLGKVPEAMGHYEQALRLQLDYPMAHCNLGNALLQRGQVSEAMGHYKQALRVNPDYAEAHNNLGAVLLQQGQVPEALEHLEQALRLKPDYVEAHVNLGKALLRLGKIAEAIGHLEQVLRLNPDRVEAHKNPAILDTLAAAYAEAGRFSDAARTAQAAIELAQAAGQAEQARQIEERLQFYQVGRAYHEGAAPGP